MLSKPTKDVPDEILSCPYGEEQYRRGVLSLGWREQRMGRGSLQVSGFHRYQRSELHDENQLCGYFSSLLGDRTRSQTTETETGLELEYATRPVQRGPVTYVGRAVTRVRLDRVRSEDVEGKHRWVAGLFAQEELRLLGGRLRLLPALGLELTDTSSGRVRSAAFHGFEEVEVDDDPEWLPRIGAIVRIRPGLRLKSNYLRAYRRPNFSELFHPDYGFVRGNPALEPEDSWNFDLGLELADDGVGPLRKLRLEAVFFHRDIKQSIEWVRVGQTSLPRNTGAARARGYELGGSLTLWSRLELSGNYTFVSTKIRRTGAPLPHVPRNQAFGRAALRLGRGRIWAELSYEDEIFLNEGGQRAAAAVTQLDVGFSVRVADLPGLHWAPPNLTVSSEWINLTDEPRVDSLGLPLPDQTLWYLRLRVGGP